MKDSRLHLDKPPTLNALKGIVIMWKQNALGWAIEYLYQEDKLIWLKKRKWFTQAEKYAEDSQNAAGVR